MSEKIIIVSAEINGPVAANYLHEKVAKNVANSFDRKGIIYKA